MVEVREEELLENFDDESFEYEYVFKNGWEPPEGVSRFLWEASPDGKHVLREAVTERKNEVPVKRQWESRLKLKFGIDNKTARLLTYMVNYIASGLSMEIRRFWEDWIEREGLGKVWKKTKEMFWAVYRERLKKPPVVEEPVGDCDCCVHQKKVVSRDTQRLSANKMWVPLPLRPKEKERWGLSRSYLLRIKQLRRFSKSLLELKLLKKLFYLKDQILQAQIKQLREKIKTEKDPVQRKRMEKILRRKKRVVIPYWEEKVMWEIIKERQESLYAKRKKVHPKVKKAHKEIIRLIVEGRIQELKNRIVKFSRGYKKARGRIPVYLYRVLYLAYWIKKLQSMKV